METTTTLTAYQLSELLRKVQPHIGRHMGYAPIQGIRFDYDGRHLHTVATDRYTMAVARQKTRSSEAAWACTVHADNIDALSAWLKARAADGNQHHIHITPGEYDITFAEGQNDKGLTLPMMGGDWPEWRGVLRTAMAYPIGEAPYSIHTADLLSRWEAAGQRVRMWQAAAGKPIVIVANEFVGLQMPARFTSEPVEMDDTLNHYEPEELAERENAIGKEIESLLKLVLNSTSGVFNLATDDTGALTAYVLAGTQSWLAYRLVKALEKADPDLLRKTLADTSDELESGEIGEWAWDEAEKAGHDPQAWHDDYEAHLKKLAADKAAKAA